VGFIRFIFLLVVGVTGLWGASAPGTAAAGAELEAALSLFNAKRYPEARPLFEKIVGADSNNAAACHYLGRTIAARGDTAALEESLGWLAKAVELEPKSAVYLGIFGGTALQVAARTHSLSAAKKGRDAMEKALAIDPDYLEAREGLFQFYERAPWPLGSSANAKAQLEEIRKRDPDLATILGVGSQTRAKNYAAAFRMCDDVLAKNPDNYTALYHFGRTASISGQHLERGLASLQKCLTFEPPTPASPTHSNVWHRIGIILEQLQRPGDARAAYETALKLDPSNQQASSALANLNKN
jgi:tetratricopeptide (TPR) repeat protein